MTITRRRPEPILTRKNARLPREREKELKAVDKATKIFVELYGPAIKELEKH